MMTTSIAGAANSADPETDREPEEVKIEQFERKMTKEKL